MHEATQFPELNWVLRRLVQGVHKNLGGNLAAVYLQGSFALGDADEYSDVDFPVLTNGEITDDQQRALQQMHADLYVTMMIRLQLSLNETTFLEADDHAGDPAEREHSLSAEAAHAQSRARDGDKRRPGRVGVDG